MDGVSCVEGRSDLNSRCLDLLAIISTYAPPSVESKKERIICQFSQQRGLRLDRKRLPTLLEDVRERLRTKAMLLGQWLWSL